MNLNLKQPFYPPLQNFSAQERQRNLEEASAAASLDLLIIGGGVNGAWIALDASMRGLKVALVEANDFGHGPSRNNSELLHGGFRYLKEWYQSPANWLKVKSVLHLVRDALREREVLMRIAPHLARPLAFCMPLYAPKGLGLAKRAFYRFGFWMYDKLSAAQMIKPHRMLSREEALEKLTGIKGDHLIGAGLYYDSKMEPGRFLIEIVKAAASQGALLANYITANEPIWDENKQVILGFTCKDLFDGKTYAIRAKRVIDATGPWGDQFRKQIWGERPASLRLSKGVHIMVGQLFKEPVACAFFTDDDRIIFIIPWGEEYNFSLIGTTDTDYNNHPDDVSPDLVSMQYLVDKVRVLFPHAVLTPYGNYAGIRPLIRQESGTASSVSREHTILTQGNSHLTSVFGGKWTTARIVAAETLDHVFPEMQGTCRTETLRLGGENMQALLVDDRPHADENLKEAAENLRIGNATLQHLIFNYGRNAQTVLTLANRNPALCAAILPDMPFIQAEIAYAVHHEMAMRVSDFLIRRSIFGRLRKRGLDAAPVVACVMGKELGWDENQQQQEVESYDKATRILNE